MRNQLLAKLDTLETKLTTFLEDLDELPEAALTARPAPDRWTLLQVAQHLLISFRHVLAGLPSQDQLVEKPQSLKNRISFLVVLAVLRLGIKVPVPADEMKPDGNTTVADLRRDWDTIVTWLRELISELTTNQFQKAYFSHPISGPLTVEQVLTLASYHFDSHRRKVALAA